MRPSSTTFHRCFIALAIVSSACAAPATKGADDATAKPTTSGDANVCAEQPDQARTKLETVIAANTSCSTDADCTHVALAASCFDSCTRPMATSGQDAYAAAVDDVTKNECAAFSAAGCPAPIHPPCAPPPPPTCRDSVCSN